MNYKSKFTDKTLKFQIFPLLNVKNKDFLNFDSNVNMYVGHRITNYKSV